MIKTNKHYFDYCKELGLNPSQASNIELFMKADNVYYSEDDDLLYIDDFSDMEYYTTLNGIDYYKHCDNNGSHADITLYELLVNV